MILSVPGLDADLRIRRGIAEILTTSGVRGVSWRRLPPALEPRTTTFMRVETAAKHIGPFVGYRATRRILVPVAPVVTRKLELHVTPDGLAACQPDGKVVAMLPAGGERCAFFAALRAYEQGELS